MIFVADTHTHTLASGHALSTVCENARAARAKGFSFLVTSDHACAMSGAPQPIYFEAIADVMSPTYEGVYLLSGCEANLINLRGELDLSPKILANLDVVIASMHSNVLTPGTREEHTRAWLAICENPDVDILGHTGDMRFDFDHEPVVKRCKETGKVIEINSHSFSARPGSSQSCRDIAGLCMRYEVPVVVSSDSHFAGTIGEFTDSVAMLESLHFPEELVLNADYDRFAAFLTGKTGRSFPRL